MRNKIDVDVRPGGPVSWQTAALNMLLQCTVKPICAILLRNTISMLIANRLVMLGGHVPSRLPRHVSVAPEQLGSCSGEWVRRGPNLDESKVLLYFHGGAYFVGSPATHRTISWRLSAATKRPVLALDYHQGRSLAESLTDACDAYRCLLNQGYAPQDILLAGDSAGGHLTLATLLALRDEGTPLAAAAICLSPWTDLSDARHEANRWTDPMLSASRIDWLARHWTAGRDSHDPLVSPVYGDYTGIPPLMIVTGSTELLRDDAHRVVVRARAHGVPVTYEEWRSMPHDFAIFADVLPEARLVFRHISRFVKAVEARSSRA
ncbi:alpha/beta hydrolase [Nonomuraea sp. 10N515B]|uniref:alpha/beta hydrolase n=1 Tax=Nonomuraea sp. 10N515B TaxID=3457422 RepID=UPI003FCE37CE